MISYEASKWYIRTWRKRWYLYAIFLHVRNFLNVDIWVDLIINEEFDDDTRKKLRTEWKDIKRHIELTKMHKYSSK